MRHGSLRLRLVAGGAAAILVALATAGAGLSYLFERHVLRSLGQDLEVHLRQLTAGIDVSTEGRLFVGRPPGDPRFADPLSGLYWQAASETGDMLRSRSLWDSTLPLPVDEPGPGELHEHEVQGPGGSRLLVVERRVRLHAQGAPHAVRLAVAADLGGIVAARRSFTAELLAALAGLGVVLALAMWVQIGLGLRPLDAVRKGVAAVREGRIPRLPKVLPREVLPLVEEVNALLEAQEKDITRSRNRAADLAHGLKTPLTALAADARRLRDSGETEIAADIEAVGEAMRRHVERELARVRVRGSGRLSGAGATPVQPVVDALIATLSRTPNGARLGFEADLGGAFSIAMDRDDLTEVLGNLLENAARHASSRVRVARSNATQPVGLFVEDDGPGLTEVAPSSLHNAPDKRLDETSGSAGLGLTIVRDILEAYGRRLILEKSPLGGLRVSF